MMSKPLRGNILEAKGVSKIFNGFSAVDNLNLTVADGDIHALIGPNGAGKTTVFNLLTRFLQPNAGRIYFNNQDITVMEPAAIANVGLVRSFQISAIFPKLSLLENVRVALQKKHKNSFCFWRSEHSLIDLNERAVELLSAVGLDSFAYDRAGDLPYGHKRALEIATTLALEPKMLLLDEPTQGMGREDIERIVALIKTVSKGRTILMVEHNLHVVETLADQITVLQRGAILAEGDYATVSVDERVREAYMGHSSANEQGKACA